MSDWTTSLGGMFKAAVVVKLMLQNGQISSLTDESQFLFHHAGGKHGGTTHYGLTMGDSLGRNESIVPICSCVYCNGHKLNSPSAHMSFAHAVSVLTWYTEAGILHQPGPDNN